MMNHRLRVAERENGMNTGRKLITGVREYRGKARDEQGLINGGEKRLLTTKGGYRMMHQRGRERRLIDASKGEDFTKKRGYL